MRFSAPINLAVLLIVTVAACGRPPAIERVLRAPELCHLLPASVKAPDAIAVGVLDDVQPEYAPWAHNESERLVFQHLYETLIVVDCLDEVGPGLAQSWEPERGGRNWLFELRKDARFWDGSRVTASDVVNCWRDAVSVHAFIDSAQAKDEGTVRVFLSSRRRYVPRELSSRAFAVSKLQTESRWPLGTGPYEVSGYGSAISAHPVGAKTPRVFFPQIKLREARDLLENDIDMMVTSQPEVLEYAAARPHLTVAPLPWDRTYVLLSVSRTEALRAGERVGDLSWEFGERLARDAVQGDARACEGPFWWEDLRDCMDESQPVPARAALSGQRRILYDQSDPVARDLAERIIALAATDPAMSEDAASIIAAVPGLSGDNGSMVAQGVSAGRLILWLRDGDEFAYIVSLRRRPADPCYEAAQLIKGARWLAVPGAELEDVLVPLVDARRHVIARRDRFGLVVDTYGDALIVNGK